MRKFLAAAAGIVVVLAGFAGAAHSSATIDLIWEDTGTNEIDDSGPQEIQLNVILTAGPAGSEGASVTVDFSEIGASRLVERESDTPRNTPTRGKYTVLPIEIESPRVIGTRVELINSVCFCDLDIGTGLEAGQSHQLGYVTFDITRILIGEYEIMANVDLTGGVLDGDGNEILPTTDITFNSAFLQNYFPPINNRNPRWKHNRYR
jgi:hypothetical protein